MSHVLMIIIAVCDSYVIIIIILNSNNNASLLLPREAPHQAGSQTAATRLPQRQILRCHPVSTRMALTQANPLCFSKFTKDHEWIEYDSTTKVSSRTHFHPQAALECEMFTMRFRLARSASPSSLRESSEISCMWT